MAEKGAGLKNRPTGCGVAGGGLGSGLRGLSGFVVGLEVDEAAVEMELFPTVPEIGVKEVVVACLKVLAERALRDEEVSEFLGEDVEGPDVGGDGLGERVVGIERLGKLAEATVGETADLVVVVEDDFAVLGDAEVLKEEIAGEDVAHGDLGNGSPVVLDGPFGVGKLAPLKVEVEGGHLFFGEDLMEENILVGNGNGGAGFAEEFLDEPGSKCPAGEAPVLKELGIGEAADAVLVGDKLVALDDLLGADGLRWLADITNGLEDEVGAGVGKDDHDHTGDARGVVEGFGEIGPEGLHFLLDEELSPFLITEVDDELGGVFSGHQSEQESDEGGGVRGVHKKIGSGKFKEADQGLLPGKKSVGADSDFLIYKGDGKGDAFLTDVQLADEIGMLVAIEEFRDDAVAAGPVPQAGGEGFLEKGAIFIPVREGDLPTGGLEEFSGKFEVGWGGFPSGPHGIVIGLVEGSKVRNGSGLQPESGLQFAKKPVKNGEGDPPRIPDDPLANLKPGGFHLGSPAHRLGKGIREAMGVVFNQAEAVPVCLPLDGPLPFLEVGLSGTIQGITGFVVFLREGKRDLGGFFNFGFHKFRNRILQKT